MFEPSGYLLLLRRLVGYMLVIGLLALSVWLWALVFTWFGG